MEKRWLYGLLIVALAFAVTGCSSIGDKIGEKVGEGVVGAVTGGDVKVDGESVTISGDDGDVTFEGGGTDLPKGFPSDFPMHDKVVVESASTVTGDGSSMFYVDLTSKMDPDELHEWYLAELEDGWEITSDTSMVSDGEETYLVSAKRGETEATLTIVTADGGSQIGIIMMDNN